MSSTWIVGLAVAFLAVLGLGASLAALAVLGVTTLVLRRSRSPSPERGDDAVIGRLLVLRAFVVGQLARSRHENTLRSVAFIRLEDATLRAEDAPRELLLRAMFYALVLAELDRRTSPTPRIRTAKKLGLRLGMDDPFPLYQRMVDAAPSDHGQAASALGLTAPDLERHRRFLFQLPIQRWR